MKYFLSFLIAIIIVSGIVFAQDIGVVKQDYKNGEILVGFNDSIQESSASSLIKSYSLDYDNSSWTIKLMIIKVPVGKEQEWITIFSKQSIVKYAEFNYVATTQQEEIDVRNIEKTFPVPQIQADSWSYGFKRFGEVLTDIFTFDLKQKIKLHTKLSSERLSEIKDLVDRGKDTSVFIEDYGRELEMLRKNIEDAGKNADLATLKNSSDVLDKSIIVLQLVYQKVPENAKQSIEMAINKSLEAKAEQDLRIRGDYTPEELKRIVPDETKKQKKLYDKSDKAVKEYYAKSLEKNIEDLDQKISASEKSNQSAEKLLAKRLEIIEKVESIRADVKGIACAKNSDCISAGCSKELCVHKSQSGIVSSCIFKPDYDCLKRTICGCNDGRCSWVGNEEYVKCLKEINK